MVVPDIPLGAGDRLKLMRPEANEMSGLVPFSGMAAVAKVCVLEGQPRVVEEPIHEGCGSEVGLRLHQGAVRWSERCEQTGDFRVVDGKNGSQDLAEPWVGMVFPACGSDVVEGSGINATAIGVGTVKEVGVGFVGTAAIGGAVRCGR